MRMLISFAALFLSVILLQLSSGALGPLDALSGFALGFSTQEIGVLGSAHFLGFFIGCWWAPRLMGSVGHARAFAAFTAAGAIALIAHMLVIDPVAWAVMRIASGMCVAGCYTVIQAYGPGALFGMISVGHGLLIVFGLTRMRARDTPEARTRYVYAPRTSFVIGRLMGRSRERD